MSPNVTIFVTFSYNNYKSINTNVQMNKEYAIQILETVERKTLEATSSLAKEAFSYLQKLKSVQKNNDLVNRIYSAKYETRHK
jgi:hypothetical protein